MWHFRRPEEEVDNYLAAMDQRLRDKLNLPPRENADALRTLIANEISMPSMTESSYRQAELIPLELRPLPSLVARPNQDASTEQPQRANKTSEQKPVDPLASIPTPVRQQIDSYQQRLRLSAETLEAINVVQQTRAAVNTLREAEHALEASNTKFRNAMEHLYGPGRDVAIASHARLARTDSAAAADTILRKRPEAFAPVITADETSTAGRRSPTENTQVARDAAAAAGDLRHVAAAHTTTVTRIRADMQLHPSVGVDAILTHCQRRLSDAQRQHERIRVTLQKLGTNGTNTVVRNAIADLKPEQRNALVAHIPSLDQIAGQVRATQSLIEGPERDGPGL